MITDVLNFPLDFTSIDDYRLKMEIENVPIWLTFNNSTLQVYIPAYDCVTNLVFCIVRCTGTSCLCCFVA